jgi:hypothetical protein
MLINCKWHPQQNEGQTRANVMRAARGGRAHGSCVRCDSAAARGCNKRTAFPSTLGRGEPPADIGARLQVPVSDPLPPHVDADRPRTGGLGRRTPGIRNLPIFARQSEPQCIGVPSPAQPGVWRSTMDVRWLHLAGL